MTLEWQVVMDVSLWQWGILMMVKKKVRLKTNFNFMYYDVLCHCSLCS